MLKFSIRTAADTVINHWPILAVIGTILVAAFHFWLSTHYVTRGDFEATVELMADDRTVELKLNQIERQIDEVKFNLQKNNDMLFQLMIAMNPTTRTIQ